MEKIKHNYPKKAGVYKLTCLVNDKIYIGKSVNLYDRIRGHKRCAKKAKGDFYFENALIKYGWESFKVEILEICENFNKKTDNVLLLIKESEYIEKFDSANKEKGYNICKYSNDSTGIPKAPFTTEHKLKISLSKKGISNGPHKKESIEKMSLAKLGKKRPEFSEEWKNNIGKGHLGMVMSEEAKEKISKAHKGKPKSKEAVEKSRQSNIGRVASKETKEKMSKSHLGVSHSDETKEKLRQINTGRKMSPEAKENMRKARLAYIVKQNKL